MPPPDIQQLLALNRAHWEAASKVHASSPYYQVDAVRAGGCSLSEVELAELGSIAGQRGLHVQCGIGLETISLARLGATMTGVDFAPSAVEQAQVLATECGVSADFRVADVLDLRDIASEPFDFIYTSHGVLRWLPELATWAAGLYRHLRPGGLLYVFEIHPLVYRIRKLDASGVVLGGNYFLESPRVVRLASTHAGDVALGDAMRVVHTDWSIGTLMTQLLDSGLFLESYHEHAGCSYNRNGWFPRRLGGLWHPMLKTLPLPLSFSLRLRRPATG